MAKDSDRLAGAFEAEDAGGLFSRLLAEEDEFDRRTLWRLGSWAAAAVGAVVVAVMANQTQLGWRREQVAASDLARQAQQIQTLTRESQNEVRRVAAAVETLNNDRDRLYSRVTVLEQGLDSVTGAIARQNAAPVPPPAPVAPVASKPQPANSDPTPPAPASQVSAPSIAPVASTAAASGEKPRAETASEPAPAPPPSSAGSATPVPTTALALVASKSIMAPPDPAATKLVEPEKPAQTKAETTPPTEATAATPAKQPGPADEDLPGIPVQRTEFAVDLGGASSLGGLRALWRGVTKAHPEIAALRPIIMVKESSTGLGMQLRLAAGPLADAAAAAKICAALGENNRRCETTVFDGQRLAIKAEETPPAPSLKPEQPHRRGSSARRSKKDEAPPPARQESSSPSSSSPTLSSLFSRR
jgi:hypothetical protein